MTNPDFLSGLLNQDVWQKVPVAKVLDLDNTRIISGGVDMTLAEYIDEIVRYRLEQYKEGLA